MYGLGSREWTDALADLEDEILLGLVRRVVAFFERDERVDRLAGELIIDTHHRGFGDGVCNLLAC